jgi:hypothetical protein
VLGLDCSGELQPPPFDPLNRYHRVLLTWKTPNVVVGKVVQYIATRVQGEEVTPTSEQVAVGMTDSTSLIDPEELPNGVRFTYYVVAQFDDGTQSGPSDFTPFATITAVNDPPVASPQAVETNEESQGVAIKLTATDDDSASLTFGIVMGPTHGTLSGAAPDVTYTPVADYSGPDSFTFKANDGTQDSNVGTVSITVNLVNDAPSFTKGPDQKVNDNAGAQSVVGWATDLSPGPPNESDQTLDFIVTNNNAALFSVLPAISSVGTLTYTPALNTSGVATVSVRIHDNGGTLNGGVDTSAPQIFTITVVATKKLTAAGPADVWLGLTKSADTGTTFDVKADVLKNGAVVACGQLSGVALSHSSDFDFDDAMLKTINLAAVSLPAAFAPGDTLGLRLSIRVASASTHATGTARLWFNISGSEADNSHLHGVFGGSNDKYYLVGTSSNPATFVLKRNDPGSGPTTDRCPCR